MPRALFVPFLQFAILVVFFFQSFHASAQTIPSALEADQFIYNQEKGLVEAKGNVILVQDGQTLNADQMTYRLTDELASASGNVILIDSDGTTHFADRLELTDRMRKGFVENLYSVLDDESRLWAVKGLRETPQKHVLKDARYTPCKACNNDPDKTPTWALRASEVVHDKDEATIVYDDVRFEAKGVPIFYIPYFSHPDGSIKQKSGFLAPQIAFGSDYGFNFMSPYYWAIAPDTDATIGLKFYTESAPQLNMEFRKRYEDAMMRIGGSVAYSDRTDRINDIDVPIDEEVRGHFEMQTLWNIDKNWRAGTDLFVTSDEQYLDQYDIDNDIDVLTNRIYAERFDNRDYASVELLAFQDLRLDQEVDQPHALPYANMGFVGKPDSFAGGRFRWDTNFLSLFRDGNEQDMNRAVSSLGWQRRDIVPGGIETKLDLSFRGDLYYTSDRDIATSDPTEDNSKFDSRAIPTANFEVAYPLHKRLKTSQIRVKPRASVTMRPDIDNDSDIPNEDSSDVQIDITNLYEVDRFPGFDRVEDRTHVNYGVETGYYSDDGNEVTFEIGQSYRFDPDDNPFPNGSGFENQTSDIVGQVGVGFDNNAHNLNYRFQLDGEVLRPERHEIFAGTSFNRTDISAVYLYDRGSPGTEFTESREQVSAVITQGLNDQWSLFGRAIYDLGEDPGLRKSAVALSYDDDCFGVTTEVQRELESESTGSNGTTILLRFRLKNLGEFETTAYDYGSGDGNAFDEDDEI